MHVFKKRIYFCFIISVFIQLCFSQSLQEMDFRNQNITDILFSLASASGKSIIPDETVTGTASFHFSKATFEQSLAEFLSAYNLYQIPDGDAIRISKIKSDFNPDSKLVFLKADSVPVELVIRALAKSIKKTILYDTLPSLPITVDIENLPIDTALEICTQKLTNFSTEKNDSYYYIKKKPRKSEHKDSDKEEEFVLTKKNDLYSLSVKKSNFTDIITDLFSKAGKEFSLLSSSDETLENLYFTEKDFDTLLRLILEQANDDYIVKNNIYYILELQKRDITKKFNTTDIIIPSYIQAQDVMTLLPSGLSSASVLKIDKNTNAIIINGTPEETAPIKKFLKQIDTPMDGLLYKRIDIKYLDAKNIISLIPDKMLTKTPVVIPGSNSILATGSKENLALLEQFIEGIDIKKEGYPVRLKYIQASDLLDQLPPSADKDYVTNSGYPNLVFYTGTEQNRKLFLSELSMIDRPKPQIQYQLLVIQYTKNKSLSLSPEISFSPSSSSSSFSVTGDLSNLLTLSFDVVSLFGYEFAVSLNDQITNSLADILTDTTLTGLSGQKIKFQNTDTYRYQEWEVDDDTGDVTATGATQSITSGLIIALDGWVSGNDMITMDVNATVSKQNSDDSDSDDSDSNVLPSTSERIVTTQVRTQSGAPVVISGLIRNDTSITENGVPLLSKIPYLGNLFKTTSKSDEKTEIVIYIVPHLIRETEENDSLPFKLERYYRTFINGN